MYVSQRGTIRVRENANPALAKSKSAGRLLSVRNASSRKPSVRIVSAPACS
jgi:hypothetical protein